MWNEYGSQMYLLLLLWYLFYSTQKYELIGYWNATGETGECIMKKYLSALDEQVAIVYNDAMEKDVRPWPNPAKVVSIDCGWLKVNQPSIDVGYVYQ